MKIAVISTMSAVAWGGSEELWAAMAAEALKEGHEVIISVYDWPVTPHKVSALGQQGAQILRRPLPRPRHLMVRIASRLRALLPLISEPASAFEPLFAFRPDVICINQGGPYEAIHSPDLLNLLYTTATPYVIVCQCNNDAQILDEVARSLSVELFTRAARVAFVAQQNVRTAERQLACSLPQAVVLRNPVNLIDLSAVPWPAHKTACLAGVARLRVDCKGQDILFEALSSSVWRNRDWRLRLYGEGPDGAYLRALAQHYQLTERLEFIGQIEDIRAIWAENHLLVLPSRAEGTPLAMVEAMLCGRPAVVTDVGGNAEWVEEQQTGFVAEAPTVRSFGAALERAWLARSAWEQMGGRAREQALVKFDSAPGNSLLKVVLEAVGLQSSSARSDQHPDHAAYQVAQTSRH